MSRRAIPRLLVLALGLLSLWAFPHRMVWNDGNAAPVPATPKADDSVSESATKLLQHRKVQKELKMSAEQRLAILDGLADIDDEYLDKLGALSNMPNANDTDYDKLDKDRQKRVDQLLADATAKSLSAAQRVRLQQLDWRLRGPTAFADPRVEKKLQLTDAQKKRVAEAAERMKGELDRYFDGGDGDETAEQRKAKLFDFRKSRLNELEGALTADQKATWSTLLGPAPTAFAVEELWLKIEDELSLTITP